VVALREAIAERFSHRVHGRDSISQDDKTERKLAMTDVSLQLPDHATAQVTSIWPLSLLWGKKQTREDEMLGLFLSMLNVRARSIEPNIGLDPYLNSVLEEVKTGISKLQATGAGSVANATAWNEASAWSGCSL